MKMSEESRGNEFERTNAITFITQYILLSIVLLFALGNLIVKKEGEISRFWSAMVGTCMGHMIPPPKLRGNGGIKWNILGKQINARLVVYSCMLLTIYIVCITALIMLTLSQGKDEITWVWSVFVGGCLGYLV